MPAVEPLESDLRATARHIIEFGSTEDDWRLKRARAIPLDQRATISAQGAIRAAAIPLVQWPAALEPKPQEPHTAPKLTDALPRADFLVLTWTVAEHEALADVLTPGVDRNRWFRYRRFFDQRYRDQIRAGAPALNADRLGSYYSTEIGGRRVLCFKSELHLNQDGKKTGEGTATLPVADLLRQLIGEVRPSLVVTVGTAGATYPSHQLGDVIITRAAKFRLSNEFRNEAFNGKTYRCDFAIPRGHLKTAKRLVAAHAHQLIEPRFGPPTARFPWSGPLLVPPPNTPDFKLDGRHFREFHPMLTTDYFEFGTSTNGLQTAGCGVEMGDAVLGMVAEELGASAPRWVVVRNASDPQINGALPDGPGPRNMQAHWAVWYYETFGYWTSVNSAIATWAIIAGD
jgi:hypothetical protein